MEFTNEARDKLIAHLDTHYLPSGLGTEEAACSVASINLAISGRLTDEIPACMSEVVGRWVVKIQDSMPDEMRNGAEWKKWLVEAAGTGRKLEEERKRILLKWMWEVVLMQVQSTADEKGFGEEWKEMLKKQDRSSALKARDVAPTAATYAADVAATVAAYAAAYAADVAADVAAYAADVAATVAAYTADADAVADFWTTINPPQVLADLVLCVGE